MINTREELDKAVKKSKKLIKDEGLKILVCAGTGCVANGSLDVFDELKKQVKELNLPIKVELFDDKNTKDNVTVKKSGCHGFCEQGPLVKFEPIGILYRGVKKRDVEDIVNKTLNNGEIVERLLYKSPDKKSYSKEEEIPFYVNQQRVTLKNCGNIDPEDINDYLAEDGYLALSKVLFEYTPKEVCKIVKKSGLRGRGGAGFPTGLKWNFTRKAKSDQKYVIINGDEGDPGAFMDRSVMEGDPHRVIEGLIIAGYSTGATKGYIYVRAEYPLAVKRLKKAIKDVKESNILGKNILESGFDFDLEIIEGAGAFVCGEETALMASIEGNRGMPRPKPPFPANSGLWGKPTNINNVETIANIPNIILKGSDWFSSIGQANSTGTKTFALTGDVQNTGLIEVPMGITLKEIVFDIGGGIKDGKEFKAVQIGGPSGGCLTKEHFDLPLDYDSLQEAGAMVGSGGMVVMDEETCMVEVSRFFLSFTQKESCGKCTPCRVGTKRMLDILERIVAGKGKSEDLDKLKKLAITVKETSLCGLGKTAPNPVLTTLRYFKDEYISHIEDKKCPS
ncbi:MAG: NADH-quinone oxidoreductase subunit NuoF, partial [Halanaerobiales bacterium]|nr:NADH-quinone oxidoreductase subunit NuoF [Halanaerobiales bacterium]